MATKTKKKITISRATTVVELVTDLSLQAEHETAVTALESARHADQKNDRLNSGNGALAAAKAVQEIESRMQESIVNVKFRALTRARWGQLADEHPARDDNDEDEAFGVNADTFFAVAVPESIVESTWKTTGEDADLKADWDDIVGELSDAQYAKFVAAVIRINRRDSEVPFSQSASIVSRS